MVCSIVAGATGASAFSTAPDAEPQTRIEARKLSDGRVEFRLDVDGTKWHPTRRFFPYRTVATDRWLRSSPYTADTVEVPPPLSVTADSPGWCLGSEGNWGPDGRTGVGSVDVTYEVSGGIGPYTITSPSAPGATHGAPGGAITVSCARDGVDLATASWHVNVVEAGPRTVRVDVTDSVGATAYAEIVIEVAENAYTSEYNGGIMCAGRTYVLGDPDPGDWVLITLPPGLYMRFSGLSHGGIAHFEEITTGSELVLDWHTGEELRRVVRSEEIEGAEEIIAAGCPESID